MKTLIWKKKRNFFFLTRDENALISEQMMSITTMTGLISRVKKSNFGDTENRRTVTRWRFPGNGIILINELVWAPSMWCCNCATRRSRFDIKLKWTNFQTGKSNIRLHFLCEVDVNPIDYDPRYWAWQKCGSNELLSFRQELRHTNKRLWFDPFWHEKWPIRDVYPKSKFHFHFHYTRTRKPFFF